MIMGVTYHMPESNSSGVSTNGEPWSYHHHWEVLEVLNSDAGPCETCGQPTVRLKAKQHVNHNGYEYSHTMDFIYAHADGTHHGDLINKPTRPQSQCPKCARYGTVVTRQLAYGDLTECHNCDYSNYYSIGD